MRLALGLVWSFATLGVLALGCGETASNDDHGGAGQAGSSSTAGSSTGGANAAGTTSSGGSSAGTSSAGGSANAGSASGGMSGSATGGTAAAGSASGGTTTGGSATGGAGQVDCDPKKILCRIVTPDCPQGEVPSVNGNCYGECVKIDRCSCTAADQCPQPEQFTCLKGPMHCSYYLK